MKERYLFLKKFFRRSLGILVLITVPLSGLKCQIYINEIMTGNTSAYMDDTWNYGGWIEIYNAGGTLLMLSGYTLTDDLSNPQKFRFTTSPEIPSKGFAQIWFENHELNAEHVDFKLNHDGGLLALFDPNGHEVARVEYPAQVQNVSFARIKDGGDEWGYCTTPTPNESNHGSSFAYERCPEPDFSLTGGVYNSPVQVKIECPAGMQIRYTTDCSEPGSSSPLWVSGTIRNFSATTIIRARVVADGFMDGPMRTHSYILSDRDHTLPVTSIVTNPENLWDDWIGIYVAGKNGIPGNGYINPYNWNRDWARPANFEYLNGPEQLFSQECDMAIGGGWTRGQSSTKSLKLRAEKKFDGKNKFDYPFFPAKPNLKFKSIYLRSSGNDFGATMMRDAVQHCFIEGVLDVEHQAYVPTIHYINGEYYGIINLRERSNHHYVYSNFGYDKEEIDLIERVTGSYQVSNGTDEAMLSLVRLSANARNASVFDQMEQLMDMDEFIAYLIVEMYAGNTDWPQNNIKIFRHQDDGKFRWMLYDLDYGMGDDEQDPFVRLGTYNNAIYTVALFQNLIKNDTFKHRFIDYFTLTLGSVYQPDRIIHIIDSVAGMIRTEASQIGSNATNLEGGVAQFKRFAQVRPERLISMMKDFFQLGEPVQFSISSNLPHATIHVNEIPVPLGASHGYTFTNKEMTVKAFTPTGYEFAGWHVFHPLEGTAGEMHLQENPGHELFSDRQLLLHSVTSDGSYPEEEITFLVDGPLFIQAQFIRKETDPSSPHPLVRINEVSASNAIYVNEYYKAEDWIELYNTSDQPVSIAGLYISREPENLKYYQIPDGPESETLIPPFGFRVLWADREEDNTQLHLPFKLAGEGGTLTLTSFTTNASGNEIVEWSDQLTYTRHSSDHTFGRYPDGSEDLYIMHRTSFAAPNLFSILSENKADDTSIEEITTGIGLEESGISLFYDGSTQELTVQMQEASEVDQALYIYNLPGQIMGQYTLPAGQSSYILPLHDLPAGYHLAVIHTSGGQHVTFRFIRWLIPN